MKMRRFLLLTVALVAFSAPACLAQSLPYAAGEHFLFSIFFKWGVSSELATVEVNLKDTPEDSLFHSVVDIKSKRAYDGLFQVRDIYECKFQKDKEVTPVWYHRDVHEGKYWAQGVYTWSEDAMAMRSVADKKNKPHRDTVYREDKVIHDVVNLLYTVRSLNVGPLNPVVSRYLIVDKDVMEIRARYAGNELKKLGSKYGTYNTRKIAIAMRSVTPPDDTNNIGLVLSAEWPEGKFGGESVFLWLSADENRLPVFFSAPLKLGSINGVLCEVDGTKNALTSKVN